MQCWITVARDPLLRKRSLKNLKSLETEIKPKDLKNDEKSEELAAVNGLFVSDISCGKEGPVEWIEVPKAYSRSFLPVEREGIATPKKIKK